MRHVAQGLSDRGVSVVTFDFPYIQNGRHVPDTGAVLEDAFRSVWEDVVRERSREDRALSRLFAGGKSMGGRIASQVAARRAFIPAPAGLIFFGYPLHPPGKPSQRRDRHLSGLDAPMLFLHGTRDPFGSPAEMRPLAESLPRASLHLIDGGDHSLQAPKRGDPGGASVAHAMDLAAEWMKTTI
jgi:predicted alpha/beta-hydrolase family hydrolase